MTALANAVVIRLTSRCIRSCDNRVKYRVETGINVTEISDAVCIRRIENLNQAIDLFLCQGAAGEVRVLVTQRIAVGVCGLIGGRMAIIQIHPATLALVNTRPVPVCHIISAVTPAFSRAARLILPAGIDRYSHLLLHTSATVFYGIFRLKNYYK